MCGIGGVFHFDNLRVDQVKLKSMSDVISYRGPDGDGQWIADDHKVGLVHRRLAIIDLHDTGRQPMQYHGGRYVISYNGEIYNYRELKSDLIKDGYTFSSTSDTEVLLALYDKKKENCLAELDGMFAFCIYDNQEKTLFCARDRFGEKPLHYYIDENLFLFGSEIKQLLCYKNDFAVNRDCFQDYINTGRIILDEGTYIKNVFSLRPGHYLTIKDSNLSIYQYWQINLDKVIRYNTESEYIDHFRSLFTSSVSRRLRSDVEFGSCLSGGLDSSSVVCTIKGLTGNPFSTFSARFDDHQKDEGKWIKEVVLKTGVRNFEVYPIAEILLSELDDLLFHHEFPVASSSQYAQWCVFRLASENRIKVLLDGQGADEYLAGYDDLKYFAIWQFYRDFRFARFIRERKFLRKNWDGKSSAGFLFLVDPLLDLMGVRRKIFDKGYSFKERLKFSIMHELGELLRYGDRSSMAFSLEVRLPFLNHELVEFVFGIPDEMIYRDGATKYILRKAMEGVIPDSIFRRYDKIGFAPPQKKWLDNPVYVDASVKSADFLRESGFIPSKNIFRDIIASKLLRSYLRMGASF